MRRLELMEGRLAALEARIAGQPSPATTPPAVPAPESDADGTAFGVLLGPEEGAAVPGAVAGVPLAPPTAVPSATARDHSRESITPVSSKRAALAGLLQRTAEPAVTRETAVGTVPGGATGETSAHETARAERIAATAAALTDSDGNHAHENAPRRGIEALVGGRWFAWLGALAVVVAMVLFLKLAYDTGYLRVSPPLRCLGVAVFGFALLGVGEWARRRVSAWASAGISAAGVAGVYASVLAAFGLYELIGAPLAFVLLAATSTLGITVAARANLASVALISIAGAYAAPLLIGSRDSSPIVFPAYLLAVLATGMVLASWRRGTWVNVGRFTWWGTMVLGGLLAIQNGDSEPLIVLAFLSLTWAAVHMAHFAATRGEATPETDSDATDENLLARRVPRLDALLVLSSFSVTGWATALAVYACRESAVLPSYLPPAAATGVTLILALWLCGALRVLVDVPRTGRERLGAALATQSGALLIAAVALGVSGRPAVPVWLAMGLAAVIGGGWIRARGVEIYGLIVMAIGAGRLLAYDSWRGGLTNPFAEHLGLAFSWWMVTALFASAAWWLAAILLARRARDPAADTNPNLIAKNLPTQASFVAMLLAMASVVHTQADGAVVAIVWLGLSVLATVISNTMPGATIRAMRLEALAIIALALATARLMAIAWRVLRPTWDIAGLHLSIWSLGVVLASLAWLVTGTLLGQRPQQPSRVRHGLPTLAGFAAVGLLMIAPLARNVDQSTVLWCWIVITSLAALVSPLRPALRLDAAACVGLLLAAGQWGILHLVDAELDWSRSGATLGLHPGLLTAGALAIALLGLATRRLRDLPVEIRPFAVLVAACLGVLLVWSASSLEVARVLAQVTGEATVRKAAISIWWGLFAAGLIGAGFWKNLPLSRHAGLALMTIAAGKVVIVDLAGVPQVWRIASFLMLGLLMLGVAFGYAKATTAQEKPGGTQT